MLQICLVLLALENSLLNQENIAVKYKTLDALNIINECGDKYTKIPEEMGVKYELDEIEAHHQKVIDLIKVIMTCLASMTFSVCACCVIPWKIKYSRP